MTRAPAGWEGDLRRWSLLLAAASWVAIRVAQVRYLGWGTGYDVQLYLQYAQQLGTGAAAYVDFHPEYPPGALPVFLFPLLWGGPADYAHAFAVEMMGFDLLACVLVFKCVEARAGSRWYAPLACALLYAIATAALFPVLYTRFDLVPGAVVLASLYCLQRRKLAASALLLGVAGAVKLWPFALVPTWLAWAWRRGGVLRAASTAVLIGVGAAVIALPVLPRAGLEVLSFLKYHAARGIQIETTWSSLALALNMIGLARATPEHNYGAFHVAGRLPALFATWSVPLTVLFALAPQVVAMVGGRRREVGGRALDAAVVGAVTGFLIAGKVLSPQYMLWLIPLLPLLADGAGGVALTLLICGLTTLVYPYLSPALEQREPGHGWALLAVGSRNLLLVGCYVLALVRARGSRPAEQRLPT
jgi:uncharacterized membrane protein